MKSLNNRGQIGLDTSKTVMISLLIIGVLALLIIVMMASLNPSANISPVDNSETFLTSSTKTLAFTPTSSFLAVTNNQTWLRFDGVGDRVMSNVSYTGQNNGAFSVSLWANATSNISFSKIYDYQDVSRGNGSSIFQDTTGNYSFNIGNGTDPNSALIRGAGFQLFGLWTHLAGTFNGSQASFYVNNVLVGQTNTSQISNGTAKNFTIGGATTVLNAVFNGSIDSVRYYNTNLSAEEVSELYDNGRSKNNSLPNRNLTFWYEFNEDSGSVAYNGNQTTQRNASIVGATYQNDGIRKTLVLNTDYTLSTNVFTLIGQNNAFNEITASYVFNTNQFTSVSNNISSSVTAFFANVGTWFALLSVVVVILIIAIVIYAVNRFGGKDIGL